MQTSGNDGTPQAGTKALVPGNGTGRYRDLVARALELTGGMTPAEEGECEDSSAKERNLNAPLPARVDALQSSSENMVILLRAQGQPISAIQRATGLSFGTVSELLALPRVQRRIITLIKEGGTRGRSSFFDSEGIQSALTLAALRDDTSTPKATRAKCCEILMNRAWGQPLQRVERSEAALPESADELDREIAVLQARINPCGPSSTPAAPSN